jgi:dihydrofolate reductase
VTSRRKVVVYVATSVDGYIARADGDVGWLERKEASGDYGLRAFLRTIDTIVWGRTTYEFALAHGGLGIFGSQVDHYVFTAVDRRDTYEKVEFVHEPVREFVARLRARPGKNVWLMGGARIIGSFLDASAVDEFMIHVIPTLIGEGIPLSAPVPRTVGLSLVSTRRYPDGVVRLTYQVVRKKGG